MQLYQEVLVEISKNTMVSWKHLECVLFDFFLNDAPKLKICSMMRPILREES